MRQDLAKFHTLARHLKFTGKIDREFMAKIEPLLAEGDNWANLYCSKWPIVK